MIVLIAAAAENNELGKNNDLIWHLPDDFKRFKLLTSGHFIIMGRKTFESFPKPLPNRTHIVITRQKNYHPEGCLIATSIENALALAPKNEDVFVIGGGEIYKQSIALADKIELTRVHHHFDADTYFPVIDEKKWTLVFEEFHPKDEKHLVDFTYQTYIKK
jgi:dihydrofolate reductase